MKNILNSILIILLLTSCNRKQEDLGRDISVPVTISEIQPAHIEKYIDITGTVKPVKEVQLRSEIAGKYLLMTNPSTGNLYILGDKVNDGGELIQLQDQEYENNVKIASAKLNLEITGQVFDKQKSLYDKGGVTLSELKTAEINFINARYTFDEAQLRLQKMTIRAPFSGVIIDLPYYTPGVKIDANLNLVKIMDYSKLIMEINLPEKTIDQTKPGQKVRIYNYTLPDDTLTGMVSQLSPAIDNETRSYKGTILVNNPRLLLRPGMYVKGEIVVASAKNIIVIPKDVVISKQRGNSVFVVDKGIAYERVVEFGLENPRDVQIISGLSMNEHLVVKGFETLRDRSKVKEMK